MTVSDYEGDWTGYRLQFYHLLRSSFIDDQGDSTFPTDDASTASAPDVSAFQGLLWAIATGLGQAQEQLVRAGSNANPATAVELLGELEKEYQRVPLYNETIADRQAALALRAAVAKGSSAAAITAALTELLGSSFVAYQPNTNINYVTTWPASPGNVGVFTSLDAERKIFRITGSVSITGSARWYDYETLGDSSAPIAGEDYCFDPDPRRRIEKVKILAVTPTQIYANFARAHDKGTVACRPHPVWTSTQRANRIVLTHAAVLDHTIRRKVHDYLTRTLGATSSWCIVSDQGQLRLGNATKGLLGVNALGSTTVPTGNISAAGYSKGTVTAAAASTYSTPGARAAAAAASTTVAAQSATFALAVGLASASASGAGASAAQKRSAGAIAATTTTRATGLQGPIGSAAATTAVSATSAATAASVATAAAQTTATAVGAHTP